ncbi:hypothetical protein HW555_002376 [Spodoptera exigua]|uniref:Uncharacterized protein n=1 Tax=Spodoptera exigua TaxID=7107 RepID=A0A835GNT1_SPOEX|nr:hypothetical protein HW555_002376 [Spodoptera exigua]
MTTPHYLKRRMTMKQKIIRRVNLSPRTDSPTSNGSNRSVPPVVTNGPGRALLCPARPNLYPHALKHVKIHHSRNQILLIVFQFIVS